MPPARSRASYPLIPAFEGVSVTVGVLLDVQVELLCAARYLGNHQIAELIERAPNLDE